MKNNLSEDLKRVREERLAVKYSLLMGAISFLYFGIHFIIWLTK